MPHSVHSVYGSKQLILILIIIGLEIRICSYMFLFDVNIFTLLDSEFTESNFFIIEIKLTKQICSFQDHENSLFQSKDN